MITLMFTNLNVVNVCCKKGKIIVTIQEHHAECLQSFIIMAYKHYNKIQSSLQLEPSQQNSNCIQVRTLFI